MTFVKAIAPALWLVTSVALGCAGPDSPETRRQQEQAARPDPYPAAYDAGRAEAEAEVAQGVPRWLRVAESDAWDQQSGTDRETGLPWVAVDGGDPATPGRVAGHNEALRTYIRQYGLPAGSRKHWERELFDLRGWFASQAAAARPIDVPLDGATAYSPDGAYALAWRTTPGVAEPTALVFVRHGPEGSRRADLPPIPPTRRRGKVEFVWGVQEVDVAVFHWVAPGAPGGAWEGYSALDLRTGLWLRHEHVGSGPGTDGQPGAATRPAAAP